MTDPEPLPSAVATNGTPRWQEREFLALALIVVLYIAVLLKGENPQRLDELHQLLVVAIPGFMVSRGLAKRTG